MSLSRESLTFQPVQPIESLPVIAIQPLPDVEGDARSDPFQWQIVHEGYHPEMQSHQEVVNNVGNTYLRIREGHEGSRSEVHSPNIYIEGLFEQLPQTKPEGEEASTIPEGVNIPNFLPVYLHNGQEQLDIDTALISDYRTVLDMKTVTLTRSFVWRDSSGRETTIEEKRFASATDPHSYVLQYAVTPRNYSDRLSLLTGIDGTVKNKDRDFFKDGITTAPLDDGILLQAKTVHSGHEVAIAQRSRMYSPDDQAMEATLQVGEGERAIGQQYRFQAQEGNTYKLEKRVTIHASTDHFVEPGKEGNPVDLAKEGIQQPQTFDQLLQAHEHAWAEIWKHIDVTVEGDPALQQALRFCKLQLYMSLRPEMVNGIGAKEAHRVGGGYHNHDFWDTPINMLPAFDNYPEIAESYLKYQYSLLDAAKEKARQNGYEGAWWQWEATVPPPKEQDGEATPKFLNNAVGEIVDVFSWKGEVHRSFDTAYAVLRHYAITRDRAFMDSIGTEMVLEAAKFYASRAEYNSQEDRYEYRDVEGPNEYHEHIHNNGFTNATAKWTMMQALELLEQGMVSDQLQEKTGLTEEKIQWMKERSERLYIPFDPYSLLLDQFEGYEDLQYVDPVPYIQRNRETGKQLDEIMLLDLQTAEERIKDTHQNGQQPDLTEYALLPKKVATTRIAKQPDRSLTFDLLGLDFLKLIPAAHLAILRRSGQSDQDILRRIRYANVYADKAGRYPGSSLGPAFFAEEDVMSGKHPDDVYAALEYAAKMDLIGGHKAEDGIHTAGLGKAIDSARKYAGIRYGIDADEFTIESRMPARWTAYGEQIVFQGARIALQIDRSQNEIRMQLLEPPPTGGVPVRINTTRMTLTDEGQVFRRPYTTQETNHHSRFPVVLFEQSEKKQGNQTGALSFDHQQKL